MFIRSKHQLDAVNQFAVQQLQCFTDAGDLDFRKILSDASNASKMEKLSKKIWRNVNIRALIYGERIKNSWNDEKRAIDGCWMTFCIIKNYEFFNYLSMTYISVPNLDDVILSKYKVSRFLQTDVFIHLFWKFRKKSVQVRSLFGPTILPTIFTLATFLKVVGLNSR